MNYDSDPYKPYHFLKYCNEKFQMQYQTFIPAILISARRHKKLYLLIEFWNSMFTKFYFKAYRNSLASSYIQNKLACYISSISSYYLPSRHKELQIFDRLCPLNSPLGFPHRPAATLHCRSIWKLNLFSKTDISKTAWINPWICKLL